VWGEEIKRGGRMIREKWKNRGGSMLERGTKKEKSIDSLD